MNRLIIILFTVITAVLFSCNNKSHTITGQIKDSGPDSYIYLDELGANEIITIDSLKLDATGTFKFKRKSDSPLFYVMKTTENSFITILIEPGENLEIVSHYDSLSSPTVLKGAAGTLLMQDYNKELMKTIEKLSGLQDIYMANIESPDLDIVITDLDAKALSYIEEIKQYTKNYIDENPTSLASLIAIYQQVAPGVNVMNPVEDFDYFIKVDSILFSLYPDSEPVKSYHEQVTQLRLSIEEQTLSSDMLSLGAVAPEISLPSVNGDTIKLSSTRGKVVLLDFWAAWCPPCRQESPHLVEAYDKFNSKGFEIFQVSLDKGRDEWLKGIEDDKLGRWIHVSDVMYWNSVVVPLYKIESIPFNLLLDTEGRIIDTNLRGERLIEVLESVLN